LALPSGARWKGLPQVPQLTRQLSNQDLEMGRFSGSLRHFRSQAEQREIASAIATKVRAQVTETG
jgi:hypothetical protein